MTTPRTDSAIQQIEGGLAGLKTNPAVLDQVVKTFVDRETERRVKILVAGIEALQAATKMLDGINKPDLKTFASVDDAQPAGTMYSERKKQEVEKQRKIVSKLAKAVDDALANANFQQLEQAVKNKGQSEDKPEAE